jgi:small nuclear ribonucleoprotein
MEKPIQSILSVLDRALETLVTVSVKGGRRFQGKLCYYDVYMNLVLDDIIELEVDKAAKRYGVMVIRGDNVVFVSPSIA